MKNTTERVGLAQRWLRHHFIER